jgi:hypothetical protein
MVGRVKKKAIVVKDKKKTVEIVIKKKIFDYSLYILLIINSSHI